MNYLKVVDNPDLIRDENSKAILNTNNIELDKYKKEREERLQLRKLIKSHEDISNRVDNIESMLKQIIGLLNK